MKKEFLLGVMRKILFSFTLLLYAVIADAQISGSVYKDFNNDGIRTLPNEIGVRNVLVSAFVGSSNSPITTRTDANGGYQFSVAQTPLGSKVRLEFTELGISNSGKRGIDSGTSVQFVEGGNTNVNLGVISNEEYCGLDGLELFASCYVNGNPLAGGNAGEDASLVMFPYSANGLAGVNGAPYPTMLAKAKEIGAVWGTDYQRSTKIAIASAIVRRHSGLGPLGTGGIYKVDFNTMAVSPLVDVRTIGIDTGPDPHIGLPADMEIANEDSLTIHAVAKTGIGGITLSKDEKSLFMINLYDRKVYSFLIGKPANTPLASSVRSYTIPDPCGDGDYRPWAIKQYGGKLYVGVVCTAETSQDSTRLKAVIYELDPTTGIFKNFFEFPLNYKKGPLDHTGNCINYKYWKPWIDKFPDGCASFFDGTHTVNFAMYPGAILTDIEFDGDGSMLVSFMDRHGLMAGYRNMRPKDDGQRYDGFVGGEILRIYNDNGTFKLENNGNAGDRTGCGVGNGEGPGGGEFYCDDVWKFFGNPAHSEIVNGGMMLLPGTGEVVASTMDPVDEIYQSAGLRVFSNFDGSMKRGYALYSNKIGTLGKSGGAGDFKATCSESPIEIGNRLWDDLDADGIQDPDEVGIDNVEVELWDMTNGGIKVSTIMTSGGGHYYFDNSNVVGGILEENEYQVRINYNSPTLIAKKIIKLSPRDVNSGAESDLRDSDARLSGEWMVISYTTGIAGETSHTLDFGVIKCIKPDAGQDLAFCSPISTEQLAASGAENRWIFIEGPAVPEVDSLTGKITKMTADGIYKFSLYYKSAGFECADTVSVKRNTKPVVMDLIGLNAICLPTSTVSLSATPTGGSWAAATNNPSNATIDNFGNVTGLTTVGFYEFIYTTIEGCKDTARVEIKNCCQKPNAGQDLSYCQPIQSHDFTDATSTTKWKFLNGPVTASIDSLSGKVSGMTQPGIYEFLLFYKPSGETCSDTAKITIKEKPNAGADFVGINAKCDTLTSFTLSATPISGTWSANPSNPAITTIDANGKVTGANKAGIYEFIYTLSNGCADSVKVEVKVCCKKPNGGQNLSFCQPISTADLVNADAIQRWQFLNGPTTASIDPTTGVVNGMTLAGIYQFLLYYTPTGTSCSDTVEITIKQKPDAGADLIGSNSFCSPLNTYKLAGNPIGGTWAALPSNPQIVTIDASGNLSPMTKVGIYEFVYSLDGCSDTVKIQLQACSIGSIGDFVWSDKVRDGIQAGNEPGIPNVTVELYQTDSDKNPFSTVYQSTKTDQFGKYLFKNLPSGNYRVKFVSSSAPQNFVLSLLKNQGSNDNLDNDADPLTGFSDLIVIDTTDDNKRNILDVDAAFDSNCTPKCLVFIVRKTK